MKIYLFLNNKIVSFTIPANISGSYSFDENPEEESKLINIEARNTGWVIYSTYDSKIYNNGQEVAVLPLKENMYYLIKRKNVTYLIYVTNLFDNSFSYYNYNDDINLIIGNDENCNIILKNNLVKGQLLNITKQGINLVLNQLSNSQIYLNNKIIKEKNVLLNNGDCINIFGFKMIFLNNLLLINNPQNIVSVVEASAKIVKATLSNGDVPQDYEIKDVDLYSKDSFFSKSPRIRRLIKTKEIKLSQPPQLEGEKEMPLLLTVGPMFTMGLLSIVRVFDTVSKISNGESTLSKSWIQLVSSGTMLLTSLLWPTLTRIYNKKRKAKKNKEILDKYIAYLNNKKEELLAEQKVQKDILEENLISVDNCVKIIEQAKLNFWDKRIEQNDFLEVRVGKGDIPLDINISYPEEGFTIEEDALKKKVDDLINEFKYLTYVPVGYSFYNNNITAIMGDNNTKTYGFINNIILQLITFYSYEDVKIVLFTNENNKDNWDYIKYLNHSFSNDKTTRFYSTTVESAKKLSDYFMNEIQNRISQGSDNQKINKPYYVIVCDDYSQIKRLPFTNILTESDVNLGFSFIILEKQMSKLPSKCNNFITLGSQTSGILINAFEEQQQISFKDEVNNNINMIDITKKLSNIPIEFEESAKILPDSITFLEMEKVGKVEQLNIMNRWQMNDSTQSLKAEVGVDSDGDLINLDLHEKYHGPHGLIAGMTGSGKSEFIITYILSMAINYSPDDVAFILIDYKGGGLAGAFENKVTGVYLPHLAGTITNLDKAEMDRTLVSIDSEIKRRQKVFNDARDVLGESTIDIYKYQRFYHEGKLTEPVPHLFIICDEFAELKSQQPDFMDNLISVARIGRSLGVHLILATQKPSGVVNDQIWSNTKFRVCLKVQDTSDSNEMLKRPEAASIKQTGRFYLQVGYDELFLLGQSGWCGAKYYPSDRIIKNVDKSVNIIGDTGDFIKSNQTDNNIKIEAQGEQIAAIMKNIIEVSNITNKKTKRLWLNDIEPIILIDNLELKYNFVKKDWNVEAIIGEYDAPEKQEQGLLTYNLLKQGNTIIYGNDEVEKEKLLTTILYSICKKYTAQEINIYAIDFGSESLGIFNNFPQVGGVVLINEDEKFKNLIKLINEELKRRKKLLLNYGSSLENYNNQNLEKLPQIIFAINNYDGLYEANNSIYEILIPIARECNRYGIYMIVTCNSSLTLSRRLFQNFENVYALHIADAGDYYGMFNTKVKIKPRNILGRGLVENDGVHEFQTASIIEDSKQQVEYLNEYAKKIREVSQIFAPRIPSLPNQITFDIVESEISTFGKIPIGISKDSLKTIKFDFVQNKISTISSNKIENINSFINSLVDIFVRIKGTNIIFVDANQLLPNISSKQFDNHKVNYYDENMPAVINTLLEVQKNPDNAKYKILYVFYGIEKILSKANLDTLGQFFNLLKENDNTNAIICDSNQSIKRLEQESWYSSVRSNIEGIWIGKGFSEQQVFRVNKVTKEMSANIKNNYGFCIRENEAELLKLLEFDNTLTKKDEEDEE